MPWRGIFVVAAGLLTSGCIFSTYQIASWTVTGVSYVFSGKGVGDHVLSLATSKDCATFRLLQAKQICVDYGSDFENSWVALASSWKVPDVLLQPDGDVKDDVKNIETPAVLTAFNADTPTPPKPAIDTAAFDTAAIDTVAFRTVAMTAPFDATPREAQMTRAGLDFKGLVTPQAGGDAADLEMSWLASAGSAPGLDFGGLNPGDGALEAALNQKIEVVSNQKTAAPALRIVKSLAVVTPGRPAIYLVVGSFRKRANAQALRDRHTGRTMQVMKILADERTMFRVLAGPIDTAVLTKTRVDIAKAGFRNAWAVRLCSGNLSPPPCQQVLQQASLPAR
jgi:hypothetical protein